MAAVGATAALVATFAVTQAPARATAAPAVPAAPAKTPVAVGYGGAVASVDADASAAGIEVLRHGGNAVDAAVATAAALGVTEPYSSGVGGGGYFVYYNARTHRVSTIDGRETAPKSATSGLFLEHGKPIPFDQAVTSGLSVGTPGTPATWQAALDAWGTRSLAQTLVPAERIAEHGFTVDQTFHDQTAANQQRFADFPATAKLFLPGGKAPAVGSTLRNPDLARTYRELAARGIGAVYHGDIGADIVRTVRKPPVSPTATRTVRRGDLRPADLTGYRAKFQAPTHVSYRGRDLYGMAPSSSGGTTVGEALNILSHTDLGKLDQTQYLHHFIEASRIAFADRGRWVGDPAFENVPTKGLLSPRFAASRACLIKDDAVLTSPLPPGDPRHPANGCAHGGTAAPTTYEGQNTTHLTVADRWGNVVAYTLTIEQTGGSGIVVPGRGFLLNNELTDFDFAPANPALPDPNLPGPGKRPRSSMSPTIVLRNGRPDFATGSPGGATIITTTLQVLLGHIDRGLSLEAAIAAPRASQRNATATELEPGLYDSPLRARLEAIGHHFTLNPEIGAATGVQRLPDGRWLAAAEPVRRGGGSAMVVRPAGRP
ncbi:MULTISPECIES: gamma-glutamyltransferase [Streptomycetaceae]|uniref:Glutathione hydrolase proenzyme n=1 Tax=Streptantibioticus cattleyicolor (strain ATCC 35852 / DSM 46488 / JCM 4925 / NBRC 14057 / NRRL 8057) TaxID=1003195 RepID=F8JYI5_STREN|nr:MULTISPECIES: gamma-glutamyltransferase [Streptomycetaceae]AEW97203.1 gamma-glutamyltransferase [Streptantibioticus cattleyicolor NRRL 8057 = DSM 46488]MYS61658.1 gamma-glutamyltransferase [Streptomyces sp. SID5468]CCB77525.1 putative gamma-glutamyltranspeptidase [Streptantibioticus cattleyicolor NRRL 8057 = DSM 46488]